MKQAELFYIGGAWVAPHGRATIEVINPATERSIGTVAAGESADVNVAVAAAKAAFPAYSRSSRDERVALLESILAAYQQHYAQMVETISREMGAPVWLCEQAQAAMGQA